MNVLVASASKHGSTEEIAAAIAGELRALGLAAEARDIDAVTSLKEYDAVIIGSAVYMGRWLLAARQFVDAHRADLTGRPVWLFSSGPLGDGSVEAPDMPLDLDQMAQTVHARDHRIFAGRLDADRLGFAERTIAKAVHAPSGDYREWDEIQAWAREIAVALGATSATGDSLAASQEVDHQP